MTPDNYHKRFGKKINLITPSELLEAFQVSGFPSPNLTPYYYTSENFLGNINSYWDSKLENNDKFLKVAIIAGPINSAA